MTLLSRSGSMNVEESQMSTNAVLNYTGGIMLFSAIITDITCGLDMSDFPFDQVRLKESLWSFQGF